MKRLNCSLALTILSFLHPVSTPVIGMTRPQPRVAVPSVRHETLSERAISSEYCVESPLTDRSRSQRAITTCDDAPGTTLSKVTACASAPPDLVSWWQFAENTADLAGINDGSSASALTYSAGYVGHAVSFSGLGDFIDVSDSPTLDAITSAVTMECWINPAAPLGPPFQGNSLGTIFARRDPNASEGFRVDVRDDNKLQLIIRTTTSPSVGGSTFVSTAPVTPFDGAWKHVAVTASTLTGTVSLYVNGQSIALTNIGGPSVLSGQFVNNNKLFIGRRQNPSDGSEGPAGAAYYHGLIDEVSLYGRALSQGEVQGIVNAGNAGKCGGQVQTIVPYQASDYRYLSINHGATPPAGFEQPQFDDSSWSLGSAAFGLDPQGLNCPLAQTTAAAWPIDTELLVRRSLTLSEGSTNVRVNVSVDNDLRALYFNGSLVAGPFLSHGCPIRPTVSVAIPQNLILVGTNVVTYHVSDIGQTSFFDASIVATVGAVQPQIGSIMPALPVATFGDQSVTVNGIGFQPGLHVVVRKDGTVVGTLNSPEQVRSVYATGFVMRVDFNGNPGSYSIQVVNPDITTSAQFPVSVGCAAALTASAPESAIVNTAVKFSSNVDPCAGAYSYDWDFGDGTPHSSSPSANHTYSQARTFNWTLRATPALGTAVVRHGTVVVRPVSTGVLRGYVMLGDGLTIADPGSGRFILDNPGGQLVRVDAVDTMTGAITSVFSPTGHYEFASLQVATYELSATVTYKFAPNSDFVTTRIPGPQITLPSAVTDLDIVAPAPIVMLHGWLSSQTKWNGVGNWAEDARGRGYIVFTPTYGVCPLPSKCGVIGGLPDFWESTARQVHDEIVSDFQGLSSEIGVSTLPNWRFIGHSQGGLIARVMVAGRLHGSSLAARLQRIYLLGTPNSGGHFYGLNISTGYYLSEDAIRRGLNSTHWNFARKQVAAFGGSYYQEAGDGLVTLESLRNIIERQGHPINYDTFFHVVNLPGCNRSVRHTDLGGPPTIGLLRTYILPDQQCPSNSTELGGAGVSPDPSTATRQVAVERFTLAADVVESRPFTVGLTDALQIDATITDGSPLVEILDPGGQVVDFAGLPEGAGTTFTDEIGQHFVLLNPAAGTWSVRVTATGAACQVACGVSESSPIGFDGGTATETVASGQSATILGQFTGGSVVTPSVTADLVDPSGATVENLTLFDDGLHGDGAAGDGLFGAATQPLTTLGRYVAVFRGAAEWQSSPVSRYVESSFDVVPITQYFTGTFSDTSLDTDADDLLDTIRFTAEATVPAAGTYSAHAELVDSNGYLITQAVGSATSTAAGTISIDLDFTLRDALCVQYGGPFRIRSLTLSDASGPSLLSTWPSEVPTATLDGNAFGCTSDIPAPSVVAVEPSVIRRGIATEIAISGTSFLTGATVSCGPGVTLSGVTVESAGRIRATATVDAAAPLGPCDVSVTNSDLNVGIGAGALTLTDDLPPLVSIPYPLANASVEGTITTSATVSDDVGIDRVEFRIDDTLVGTDATFPYQYGWDTASTTDGPHDLSATAFDTAGFSTVAAVTVTVDNCRITAEGDLAAETGPGAAGCGTTVAFSTPSSTFECGTVTCTPSSGSFFPVGTTTVTCTSTTGESVQFNVVVADTTPPTGSCPPSQTLTAGPACTAEAPDLRASMSAADNCTQAGGLSITQVPAPGVALPLGQSVLTLTVTDAAGNSFMCQPVLTVEDATAPTVTCPQNVTVTAPSGQSTMPVSFDLPLVVDNCAGATVSCLPAPGSSFPVGVTTVDCTGSDASSNLSHCQFTVTVNPSAVSGTDTVGVYNSTTGAWFLKNTNSGGSANLVFSFGPGGAEFVPLKGDWNGDGIDTPGLYVRTTGVFFLRNTSSSGPADVTFSFGAGNQGFVPVTGDWNNDGADSIGLYVPTTGVFFLRNGNSPGPADITFSFGAGNQGFVPVTGDWNSDGVDTVGLYVPTTGVFFLRNVNSPGPADITFSFGAGNQGFVPVTGDWNGDGTDTIGLYVPTTGVFFLRNANSPGSADLAFGYGPNGVTAVLGDWDGQ